MAKAKVTRYRGKWAVRWRNLEGKQRTKTCSTKKAAQDLCTRIQYFLDIGEEYDPSGRSQGSADVDLYKLIVAYAAEELIKKAPRTREMYGLRLDRFISFLEEKHRGGAPLTLLTRSLLEDFFRWCCDPKNQSARGRSDYESGQMVAVVERMWSWADNTEKYETLPRPRRIDKPEMPEPNPIGPTWAEYRRMIAQLRAVVPRNANPKNGQVNDPLWAVKLATLFYYTGMRKTAAMSLKWEDIDLDGGQIVVPAEITKGRYGGRTIPLHADFAARMKRWRKRGGELIIQPPPSNRVGNRRGDNTNVNFHRAFKRAGVPIAKVKRRPLHCARHMHETEWAVRGVDQRAIDLILAHKPQGTGRRRYQQRLRLWPTMVKAIAVIPALDYEEE